MPDETPRPDPMRPDPTHPAGNGGALPEPSAPSGETPPSPEASAPAAPANPDEIRERVIEVLHTVYDPEIPVDIYELGLVYAIEVDPAGVVRVRMTLTSPACPVAGTLPGEVEQRLKTIEGVTDAIIELVWDPPWDLSKLSEAARLTLGMP